MGEQIPGRKSGTGERERVQMAAKQEHNIDNMVIWQREKAVKLVMYAEGLAR